MIYFNVVFSISTSDHPIKTSYRICLTICVIRLGISWKMVELSFRLQKSRIHEEIDIDKIGAGPVAISKWYNMGYRSLSSVLEDADSLQLTAAQKIGIKYYKVCYPR